MFMYANYYQTSVQPRRIGYTTNYGNGFNTNVNVQQSINYNQFRSVNIHGNSLVTNKPYMPIKTYNGTSAHYSPSRGGGPRKSPQRPYSGNFFEDLADWWRINTDSNWPSYVDEDYWEEFLAEYPEYEDEARAWFESQGLHFPGDPDDPFLDPIGEPYILLGLALLYGAYSYRKKKTASV